ncbi:MAG: hypothetical protein OEY49_03260 [Candidatus Heimdallarchaeota archaeon]|nr:hypothetical protein [Candidatus Heimdallarchaeota archaeon]
MDYKLVEIDPKNLNEFNWEGFHNLRRILHDEVTPDDPIQSDEVAEHNLRIQLKSPEFDVFLFEIYSSSNDFIGFCYYGWFKESSASYENNKSLGTCDITLLSNFRRFGIGTSILKRFYTELKSNQKEIIMGGSIYPASVKFVESFGGIMGLAGSVNRLTISDLDSSLIDKWILDGEATSPDSKFHVFNEIPEEYIERVADIMTETLHQIPMDDLEVGQMIFTPETIRQREAEIKLMNKISLTGIFEESNGQLSGFSNLGYSLDLPEMVKQGLTSVREEYRGKGLGKRIKAIMIKELLKINKSVKFIDTDNANSNAPMLAINERMGFRKYKETYQFQIKLDELEKRITQKSGVVII